MSDKDLRQSVSYRDIEALVTTLRRPGTGRISDAAEPHASPNGTQVVFAGTLVDALEGEPPTRICQTDLTSGDTRLLTYGPNMDRSPRYSPDGRYIAFLSDRRQRGDFQLYLLDAASGAARPTPPVRGWIEYLHWSPNGKQILLGVAGWGADVSGGQGAIPSKQMADALPSWIPSVETGTESFLWRRVWIYELATDRVRQVSRADSNVWEAVWCGTHSFAAAVSSGPAEGLWYSARLVIIETEAGHTRPLYAPQHQMGCLTAAPSGERVAIVEALCSDRWIVAGDLRLIETESGKIERMDTHGVDITHTEWRSDRDLLVAGHRGFETIVGRCDSASGTFTETWRSRDLTTGGRYVTVSGLSDTGDCVLIGESFTHAPEIAVIRQGVYRSVKSFDLGYADETRAIQSVLPVNWMASDGLEIQGWLLQPRGQGPHALVMNLHGGPVWHWRPTYLGRSGVAFLMLLQRGYAVFLPNPRGSSGRGQDYARRVLGDMGGADTYDLLSGLDHLAAHGIADPKRLGVTGGSYGGYMTSWLITQDSRFAAAVSIAPVTNRISARFSSNIPEFIDLFMADDPMNPAGRYFSRSPIFQAHKAKTGTLNICGALDRCTPPSEAVQFHNALLQNGVESKLVTYPEEGHGVHKFPAAIDYAARLVDWFTNHLA